MRLTNVTLADFSLNVPNFLFILIETNVFISIIVFLMTSLNIVSF